jgi:two-component system alkaline phosphatase synthesis response regulator PhoP
MVKRVLIAEDDPGAREALAKHFTMRRYQVVSVTNGIRLLEAASRETFDLIVTDIMMPDLNGDEGAEIIKYSGTTTPIIALTALSPTDLGLSHKAFTKVFYKPIKVNELFVYIETLLRDRTA